jgi:curved DNA-binding protein CbpA
MAYWLLILGLWFLPAWANDAHYAQEIQRVLTSSSPHEALGVSPRATIVEVKAAHRRMILLFHGAADRGDPQALSVVQYVNSARDYLLKPPLEGRRAAWTGPPRRASNQRADDQPRGGAAGGASEKVDPWKRFWSELDRAPDREKKIALRTAMLNQLKKEGSVSFSDFQKIIHNDYLGINSSPDYRRSLGEWVLASLDQLEKGSITGAQWRTLHRVLNLEPRKGYLLFRKAIETAQRPEQILSLLRPSVGITGGGPGWTNQLEAATRDSLFHFFKLQPNQNQVLELTGILKASFGPGVGHSIFLGASGGKPRGESFQDLSAVTNPRACNSLYQKIMDGFRSPGHLFDREF